MKFKALFKKGEGSSGMDLLSLEGQLDIRNIKKIKSTLEEQLKSCNALEVRVQDAEPLDLSFLQLLIALKIKFKSEEKPLHFSLQLDEESKRLINVSGFAGYLHSKL